MGTRKSSIGTSSAKPSVHTIPRNTVTFLDRPIPFIVHRTVPPKKRFRIETLPVLILETSIAVALKTTIGTTSAWSQNSEILPTILKTV